MIQISIDRIPVPWTAARVVRNFHYDPREKEKRAVRQEIRKAYAGEILSCYVVIDFTFFFPFPASASKKKIASMLAHKIYPTRCDCTNLQKLYEDCLKKIVITDDRNVVKISSQKLYARQGKILITITPLEEYQSCP